METPTPNIKLRDHCGEKPRKVVIQPEKGFDVVCIDCSAKYFKPPKKYIDRED